MRNVCHQCGVGMVANRWDGGIHCPICRPAYSDDHAAAFREWTYGPTTRRNPGRPLTYKRRVA